MSCWKRDGVAEVEYNRRRGWMAMAALPRFVVVDALCAERTRPGRLPLSGAGASP